LDWDQVSSKLSWQAPKNAAPRVGSDLLHKLTVQQPTGPAPIEYAAADRLAVDRYFAQTADDTDEFPEGE
jgi:hypothetical protein